MKVSKELSDILRQASAEVNAWPKWKRSLDPIGDESRNLRARAGTSGKGENTDAKPSSEKEVLQVVLHHRSKFPN